jgi:hypothetical protein
MDGRLAFPVPGPVVQRLRGHNLFRELASGLQCYHPAMVRRIGRGTADSRLFAIFGMGRAWDDLANESSPWIAEREQQGKLGLNGP